MITLVGSYMLLVFVFREQIKEAENQRIQCLSMQADLQAKFFRDDHNDGAGEGSAPVA